MSTMRMTSDLPSGRRAQVWCGEAFVVIAVPPGPPIVVPPRTWTAEVTAEFTAAIGEAVAAR